MAKAKVQVTLTYEYTADYDADAAVYEENERISNEAETTLKELVGSFVDITKDGTKVVQGVKITSSGLSVSTVPGQ